MAKRLHPQHDAATRARIKVSVILSYLYRHVRGEVELSMSQIRAAEILLRKVLPDLQSITLQNTDGGPIVIVTGIHADPTSTRLTASQPTINLTPTKSEVAEEPVTEPAEQAA